MLSHQTEEPKVNWFIVGPALQDLATPSPQTGNYKLFVWDKQKIFDRKQFKIFQNIGVNHEITKRGEF